MVELQEWHWWHKAKDVVGRERRRRRYIDNEDIGIDGDENDVKVEKY